MSPTPAVIPVLVYANLQAAHDFLVNVFGFESGGVVAGADGRPVHGEVNTGGGTIWLHRVSAEHELTAPAALPAQSGGLAVVVDDVDAHYERARAGGAVVDSAPTGQPYGRREYGARDPEGHRWWFGTPTS